jgi:hypothetical protein
MSTAGNGASTTPTPDFYDVFISYRHRDEEAVKDLEAAIRSHGFEPFLDFNFPNLKDPSDVTRDKIEDIRQAIARATCLIFAYSKRTAGEDEAPQSGHESQRVQSAVGLWMPWELGFFNGSLDRARMTWVRTLRMPMIDQLLASAHAQLLMAARGIAELANAAAGSELRGNRERTPVTAAQDLVETLMWFWSPVKRMPRGALPAAPPTSQRSGIGDLATEPAAGWHRPRAETAP